MPTRHLLVEEKAVAGEGEDAARSSGAPGRRAAGRRQLGYGVESVRMWVKQADVDDGVTPGVSSAEAQRVRALEQEVRELRRANEVADLQVVATSSANFSDEIDSRVSCVVDR